MTIDTGQVVEAMRSYHPPYLLWAALPSGQPKVPDSSTEATDINRRKIIVHQGSILFPLLTSLPHRPLTRFVAVVASTPPAPTDLAPSCSSSPARVQRVPQYASRTHPRRRVPVRQANQLHSRRRDHRTLVHLPRALAYAPLRLSSNRSPSSVRMLKP